MESKTCLKCGAKVNDDDIICPECGDDLELQKITSFRSESCVKCGAKVNRGDKVCPECGDDLESQNKPVRVLAEIINAIGSIFTIIIPLPGVVGLILSFVLIEYFAIKVLIGGDIKSFFDFNVFGLFILTFVPSVHGGLTKLGCRISSKPGFGETFAKVVSACLFLLFLLIVIINTVVK